MGKFIDLTGRKFGRLTALYRLPAGTSRLVQWVCECECGNEYTVISPSLTQGNTNSCGCINTRFSKGQKAHNKIHGLAGTKLYGVWKAMLSRCYSPKNVRHQNYSRKGIEVCDEWRNSAVDFIRWCEANGYEEGLCLDRRDNDGDYTPANCRFVTPKVNAHNADPQFRRGSGYTGVCWDKRVKKFCSYISGQDVDTDSKRKFFGHFKTLKEALEARNKFIVENNLPHKIQEYKE